MDMSNNTSPGGRRSPHHTDTGADADRFSDNGSLDSSVDKKSLDENMLQNELEFNDSGSLYSEYLREQENYQRKLLENSASDSAIVPISSSVSRPPPVLSIPSGAPSVNDTIFDDNISVGSAEADARDTDEKINSVDHGDVVTIQQRDELGVTNLPTTDGHIQ